MQQIGKRKGSTQLIGMVDFAAKEGGAFRSTIAYTRTVKTASSMCPTRQKKKHHVSINGRLGMFPFRYRLKRSRFYG